ncbi:MAG: response regulator transcription factor [Patescibacteria group bacterium]|jgi:two-component system OmpR family response regulator
MALLIIEDDQDIVLSLTVSLNQAGFEVSAATDGLEGLQMARSNRYELIILDCNLPRLSGFEIIKTLRAENIATPIIMLTVLSELNDKITALDLGSDDYLSKPFSASELIARIKAQLRRPQALQGQVMKLGNLELDPSRFLVKRGHKKIKLSTKEFTLLELLLKNKGHYLPRQKIIDQVWDENADPFSNTLEVHIMNLRKKLASRGQPQIYTASNRGYKIDLEK